MNYKEIVELLPINLIIREWLNGSLFPLSAFLCYVICHFLYGTRAEIGPGWQKEDGVATACALAWIFFCESVRAGGVWWILRTQNDGHAVSVWMQWVLNIGFCFSAAALIATILRCTFLFSPPSWGHRYWIASALTTLVFLLVSHFTPTLGY